MHARPRMHARVEEEGGGMTDGAAQGGLLADENLK